jgi:diphthamide biosynthesis enzyme Dph1/Dph2-like protein
MDISNYIETLKLSLYEEKPISKPSFVLFYDPSYFHCLDNVVSELVGWATVSVANLPACADMNNWRGTAPTASYSDSSSITSGAPRVSSALTSVGGLLVDISVVLDSNVKVLYIGSKHEQLVNIYLRLANKIIYAYDPTIKSYLSCEKGVDKLEFRERYGGVLRVKDAHVIGIIVASMGLTGDMTREVLEKLQKLIVAARKTYYTFVMGRLNEAKLCNFPEVLHGSELVFVPHLIDV